MPSSTSLNETHLESLLKLALPFLRGELHLIDPNLHSLVSVLKSVGAGECWHKHGTFLAHLLDVYRILKLWHAPDSACLCGLFHSAYSNSYVNLAIFHPTTGRHVVRSHVGDQAEHLIHLFCIIPRHSLIHDDLLFHYSEEELATHLKDSDISLRASENGSCERNEIWRKKLAALVPPEGIKLKHIKTGEDVEVSRRIVALFLLLTMADFSDQLFSFQDELFNNSNGRLEYSGNNIAAIWPGEGKPGLWLTSVSKMGALYTLIAREEMISERESGVVEEDRIELVIPPILENCCRVLGATEQIVARDLYWEAISGRGDRVEEALRESIEKNGFVGEPYVVLSQVLMREGRYEEAEEMAKKGVALLLQWGTAWDKRISWEGWVAWGRVLLMKAQEKSWPSTSFGILNLGLVK